MEIPYDKDAAEVLVTESTDFDTWLNEVVFDLENFRTKEPKEDTKAPKTVPGKP